MNYAGYAPATSSDVAWACDCCAVAAPILRCRAKVMNKTLPPNLGSSETENDPDEFLSLPGWLYHDEEFFAYEADHVFRPSWQVVCHVNNRSEEHTSELQSREN